MSVQRTVFEAEVKKPSPDWTKAIDNLNALAMFEMLPTLAALSAPLLKEVMSQAWRLLSVQREWKGSHERIVFAEDVVTARKVNLDDHRVPAHQIGDAVNYLIDLLKPSASKAATTGFSTLDAAAVVALDEILPTTRAVNLEFSGSIYSQSGTFRFTAPVRGEVNSSNSNVPVPPGTKAVAVYHTHPATGANVENFSPPDIIILRGVPAAGIPPRVGYLGTPSGKIKKLTPPELLSGKDKELFPLLGKQEILR